MKSKQARGWISKSEAAAKRARINPRQAELDLLVSSRDAMAAIALVLRKIFHYDESIITRSFIKFLVRADSAFQENFSQGFLELLLMSWQHWQAYLAAWTHRNLFPTWTTSFFTFETLSRCIQGDSRDFISSIVNLSSFDPSRREKNEVGSGARRRRTNSMHCGALRALLEHISGR